MSTASTAIAGAAGQAWWLDVESANTWNGDGSSNAADLQGEIDYLRAHGIPAVGLYSNVTDWRTITGGYTTANASTYAAAWQGEFTPQFPIAQAPTWVAGAGSASEAATTCAVAAFMGALPALAQYADGSGYDADLVCGTSAPTSTPSPTNSPTPPPSPPPTASPVPTPTPIGERNLTAGNSGTSGTTLTTAAISPTAKALELAAIEARSSRANVVPTLSGCNFTWVRVVAVPITATSPFKQLTLFRAQGTPPSSCRLTFRFGQTTMTNFAWSVTEYANVLVDTANNGAGALRQARAASGNAAGAAVTLSAFASNDATFGVTGINTATTITPGSGFTRLDQQASSTAMTIASEWRSTSATTVDSKFTSTRWAIIGAEIAHT